MSINSRDFVDKFFMLCANGKFYKYSCSVPNSEKAGANGEPPMY